MRSSDIFGEYIWLTSFLFVVYVVACASGRHLANGLAKPEQVQPIGNAVTRCLEGNAGKNGGKRRKRARKGRNHRLEVAWPCMAWPSVSMEPPTLAVQAFSGSSVKGAPLCRHEDVLMPQGAISQVAVAVGRIRKHRYLSLVVAMPDSPRALSGQRSERLNNPGCVIGSVRCRSLSG